MKPLIPSLFAVVCLGAAIAQAKPSPAPVDYQIPKEPVLTTPKGDYQIAWLEIEGGKSPVRAFLALRDGKPAQFWALDKALPGFERFKEIDNLIVDGVAGQSTGERITAEIVVRLTGRREILAVRTLKLEFSRSAGMVSGKWEMLDGGQSVARGTLTGSVRSEAQLAQTDAFAKGQDWPSFYGKLAASRGPDYGKPFVDDLAEARPLWRSEVKLFTGWGNGADARYRTVAGLGRLCGGSSSPVAADGLVYYYSYVPSGDGVLDEAARETVAKFEHPPAKDEMTRWYSVRADVVVTAIDEVTGKTVWQSTWPRKQGNFQTHKWRGLNHAPAVANGVLVVSDYSWGLHAFDAKTGRLKWSQGGGGPVQSNRGSIGPVISGNTVVWCTEKETSGLDLATGELRWKSTGATGARRMVLDGKERVLLTGATLTLVDPADGKTLTTAPFPGGFMKKGSKELGRGFLANLLCSGPYIVSFETNLPDPAKGAFGTVFARKVSDTAIEPAWRNDAEIPMEDGHIGFTIAGGKVFTAGQKGGYAIDLATGKTVKQVPELAAHSNPIFVSVDNRILWQPECQHGTQHIQLLDADTFTPLGTDWHPPHNDTTAYGEMPICNIVVDGRLIIRGMDGIYCYDVRKSAPAAK